MQSAEGETNEDESSRTGSAEHPQASGKELMGGSLLDGLRKIRCGEVASNRVGKTASKRKQKLFRKNSFANTRFTLLPLCCALCTDATTLINSSTAMMDCLTLKCPKL